MSSSQSRGGERMVHQDYIARIRYSNALPPPPNPPKLLDVPNTGLSSGQYTTPGFASRLARDQPLNIEVDAELGMPLDLVGMPGIFDGDESSIQAPLQIPAPHPHDRALLRPLSTLGKPKFTDSGVSFLRRTEYISSHTSRSRFESTTSKSLVSNTGSMRKPRPAPSLDVESPEYIKKQIEKGFQTAATNLKDPSKVRHPTKRNVQLVDAYPLLPDLDAFPDAGGYVIIKFLTNPVAPSSVYDIRLATSLLQPVPASEAEEARKEEMKQAHERDPERNPPPEEVMNYEFYMPESTEEAINLKRKLDVFDEDKDDDDLYTHTNGSGQPAFRFKRLRAYESAQQSGSIQTKYDEEVVIAIHDGSDGLHQKAAYYYPILQKASIRPQRTKNISKFAGRMPAANEDDSNRPDYIDLEIEEPSEQLTKDRNVFREFPYGKPAEEEVQDAGQNGDAKDRQSNTPESEDAEGESE